MRWPRSESLFARSARPLQGQARSARRHADAVLEHLEERQLLTTVFAVTDNNVLLEFDSAQPQTILRATPITGLGDGEIMSAIDFHSGTEKLYGIPSGSRTPVYTIDRKTAVATRVGPGVPFNFPLDKSTGLDFDEHNGYFRYIDELYGNYRISPVSGLQLRNDAGQEGLAEIAYRPLNGNPANFGMVGINHKTDEFMQLDPERMTVLSTGSLGVDADHFVGLDIAPDGTTLVSLRIAGISRFGTISSADGHSFVELGTIGNGTQYAIRGLAAEPARRAPVLDSSLSPTLSTIDEDDFANQGTRIGDLIQSAGANLISDASPGAVAGIALTFADTTAGQWQYSLNGVSWTNLGDVSDSSALLLPGDGAARIRLLPRSDFNGAVAQALSFRAWDQIGGAPGQRLAIDSPILQDSLSPAAANASITITPVRDAPSISSPSPSGGIFNITDQQTLAPFQSVTITSIDNAAKVLTIDVVIDDATHGSITPDSAAANGFTLVDAATGRFRFTGTPAEATTAIRQLIFKPTANLTNVAGQTLSRFTIQADDGLGPASQALSAFISVQSVNDAPAISGLTIANKIKLRKTIKPFRSLVIADVDPSDTVTVTIKINTPRKGSISSQSLRASGFVKIANGKYRFTGSAAAATTAARKLKYGWSTTLNTAIAQQVKLKLTITDAAGATLNNNQTAVTLKR